MPDNRNPPPTNEITSKVMKSNKGRDTGPDYGRVYGAGKEDKARAIGAKMN